MAILEAPRLILRPFKDSDSVNFSTYRSDPDIARYQSWEIPYTLEQAQAFIRDMQKIRPGQQGQWFQWAIERRDSDGLIGDCAFQILEHDSRQAQIGVSLSKQHQGHGYGTEAVARLMDYLFGELGVYRVTATCDAQNQSSIKLLERLGMRREGHFIENIWFKGKWGSEYAYAVLKRDWPSCKKIH